MTQKSQQIDNSTINAFLEQGGWGNAERTAMGADMGLRRYYRLTRGDETALLMDMSRAGRESGLKEYVEIDQYFETLGIRVPEIYHYDLESGLAIIETLGAQSFGQALLNGENQKELYRIATNILICIKDKVKKNDLGLPNLENSIPRQKLKFFVQSYMPMEAEKPYDPHWLNEFEDILQNIMNDASPCPETVGHADFHLENLIWRPDTNEKYGLIDFQDAYWVQQPYDLVNLLEDARQTVPADIKREMKALYCKDMNAAERKGFDDWYVILSIFFHLKVLGQITYYYQEHGMGEYLEHIPRLQGYITENLKNPLLQPLKEWLERHNIRFDLPITL